ncbi:hypothetical protein ADUPG1_012792 [Aduncisulcus paluster]|uniref:Chaoptin n=1 Tax=Aduncisulcus paluster TaxID=2918883 RepID=A0ABQ5K4W7_9EUKA|nr:hypothetical protein ADUPG1_012792 [Aduncisulcus paluster]
MCKSIRGDESLCDLSLSELNNSDVYHLNFDDPYCPLSSLKGIEYLLSFGWLSCVSTVFDFQLLAQLPNFYKLAIQPYCMTSVGDNAFFGLNNLDEFYLMLSLSADLNPLSYLNLHSLYFSHNISILGIRYSSIFDISPVYKNVTAQFNLEGGYLCYSEEETEFVSYLIGTTGIFNNLSSSLSSISCSLETLDDSGQCDPTDPLCPSIVHNEVYNPYSWNGTGNIPGSKECSYISLREEDPLDSSSFVCHTIHDATLRKVINIALGNDNVDSFISVTDMRQLSGDLDVNAIITDNPDQFDETDIISSLRGIEYALSYVSNEYVGLTSITVSGHNIEDIEPLRYLVTLTSIDISDNQVSDVFPLFELSNLENLNLSNNPIDPTTFTVASLTSMFTQTDITIQVENIGGTTQCGTESATMPLDSHVVCRREEDDYLLDCAYGYYITSDSDDIICSDQPNNICLGKYPMKSCVISDNSLYPFWRCVNGKYGPQCSYSVDIPDVRLRMKLCEIIYGQYGTCDLTESTLNSFSGDDGFLDLSSSMISDMSGIENLSNITDLDLSSCVNRENHDPDYNEGNILSIAIDPLLNMPNLSSLNIDCRLSLAYELVYDVARVWKNLETFSVEYGDNYYQWITELDSSPGLYMKSFSVSGDYYYHNTAFLSGFPNLEELYLAHMTSYSVLELTNLSNLSVLKHFDANSSWLNSSGDLINFLPSLEYLNLSDTLYSIYLMNSFDADALLGKDHLVELHLDMLDVGTSYPFFDLNLLTTLSIFYCEMDDISGLFYLDNLQYINANYNYFFINNDIDNVKIQEFLHPSAGKGVFPNIGDDSMYMNQNTTSDDSKGEINIFNNHFWSETGSSHFCSQISKYVKSKDIDENSWDYCQTVHDRHLREYLCEYVFRNSKDCFIRVDQLRNLSASDINSSSPGHLDLSNLSINSLRGLEFMTSLTFLDLSSNNIDDYTPILYLPNLININLSSNPICAKSSADLLRFVKLEYCSKHPNNTACLNSKDCFIRVDQLRNLSASDINSSSPGHLDLSNLSINSLRGLEFMTSLTFLDLSSNNIDDYTPILYLPNLININLSSNPICAKSSADLLRFVKLEYCSKHPNNTACLSESLVIVADSIRCPTCSGDVIDADIVTNNSICHLGMVQCRLGYGLHVENQRCVKSTDNTCHICDAIGSICVASDDSNHSISFSCGCYVNGDNDNYSIDEAQRCGSGTCSPSSYQCDCTKSAKVVKTSYENINGYSRDISLNTSLENPLESVGQADEVFSLPSVVSNPQSETPNRNSNSSCAPPGTGTIDDPWEID